MKLRIQNFRSLKDTGDIEIKPITILVGKNSSGKSSFLRTFPMLKQSTQERTISPILLYGDYVDFGSYKDIKPNFGDKNQLYELGFTFTNIKLFEFSSYYRTRKFLTLSQGKNENVEVNYSLKFSENKKQLIQITTIAVIILGYTLTIDLDQEAKKVSSIKVNGKEIFEFENNLIFLDSGEFNVDVFIERKAEKKFQNLTNFLSKELTKYISNFLHRSTQEYTKENILKKLSFAEDSVLLKDIKSVGGSTTWKKKTEHWTPDSIAFIKLKELLFVYDFFYVYSDAINNYLKNFFLNTNYIAPLRATAERYYRIQQLAVDEVDQNGKNLPVFLGSLSESQLNDFQQWTFDNFGFKTKISKSEGHYSIKIVIDNHEVNLSDTGFGYSQILPILTQIWFSSSKQKQRRNKFLLNEDLEKIIVIEQPELHLHPEFQARFADAISRIITSSKGEGVSIKLVIETHSDIILNRLGDCILNEEISHDDINIIIFNKESEKSPTEICISQYDGKGNLLNWPVGFFQPSI